MAEATTKRVSNIENAQLSPISTTQCSAASGGD
jgi:hypothetical protein